MKNKTHTLTVTTNYLNHYSLALVEEFKKFFDEVYFVVNEKLPEDRKKLGFNEYEGLDFVVKEWEEPNKVEELFLTSDFIITDYNYRKYLKKRLKLNKLTIYQSERLFKTTNIVGTILRYIKYWYLYHGDKKSSLLCISAYAGSDYNDIGLFKNRTLKWGYFPPAIIYDDVNKIINSKKENSIIWVGRLIDWKHPEYAIEIAKKLSKEGYDFSLNIIGTGEMEYELERMIKDYQLGDKVHLLGSMSPEKVREYMDESQIYLFTSNRGEGWGVVLNEAMNSCCACVASESAGSTPYLLKDGKNGLIYKNDSEEEAYKKIKYLLDNKEKISEFGKEAYDSIINEWNPNNAAKKLYELYLGLLDGKENIYKKDILSKDKIIE